MARPNTYRSDPCVPQRLCLILLVQLVSMTFYLLFIELNYAFFFPLLINFLFTCSVSVGLCRTRDLTFRKLSSRVIVQIRGASWGVFVLTKYSPILVSIVYPL